VVAADREGVAVSHEDDHVHVRSHQLDAGGEGQGPTMRGVQGVGVQVDGNPAGAPDAGDDRDVVLLEPQSHQRASERP